MANMYGTTNSPICGPFGIPDPATINFTTEISMPTTRGTFHKDFSASWSQLPLGQAVYPVNVARTQTTGHEMESCQQVYKPISIKSERTIVSQVEHLENDIIRRTSPPKYYTEQYAPKDCALTLKSPQDFKMTMPPPQDFTMTPSPQNFTITAPSSQDCGIGSSSRNFESVTSSPPDYEATYPQFDPCSWILKGRRFNSKCSTFPRIPTTASRLWFHAPTDDLSKVHGSPDATTTLSTTDEPTMHATVPAPTTTTPATPATISSEALDGVCFHQIDHSKKKPSASIGKRHSLILHNIMLLLKAGRLN